MGRRFAISRRSSSLRALAGVDGTMTPRRRLRERRSTGRYSGLDAAGRKR